MPPVGLQLGLAGAAGADGRGAAGGGLPHQVGPHAGQARKQVLVLRQLHLQLTLAGAGTLSENIQNEARAVQDFDAQLLAQHPHLGGRELVVKNREIAVVCLDQFLHLPHLAVAQEAARFGRGAALDQHGHGFAPGGLHQGGQLLHGDLRGAFMLVHTGGGEPRQHSAFFLVFHMRVSSI